MLVDKLLSSPALPAASALVLQVAPSDWVEGAPAWAGVFLMGVWVTVSILGMVGKLPDYNKRAAGGQAVLRLDASNFKEHTELAEEVALHVKKVHDLLAHRSDGDDGIERFLVQHQLIRQQAEILQRLEQHGEKLSRIVGLNVDELRALRNSINALEQRSKGGRHA